MIALPIDPQIPAILAKVRAHPFVVLTATPGAGKTTRLPPEFLSVVSGKVVVLEPRRVAALASAARIAEERGWALGGEVGYQVRFEAKITRATRLIFMTDALLLRRMVDDPELRDVDLVVIDEFHERNLNQDLILGALRELRELGREIRVVVMSATLDLARLARFLPGSAVIDVPGVVHPLEIRQIGGGRPIADFAFCDAVARAVLDGVKSASGDVLVFLPGVGEINRVRERLNGQTSREIVALHGSLPLDEQRRVLTPAERRRIILATNVAEASVTVPGVNCVVDGGLMKTAEMNPRTGFSSLETRRIAEFNARQRAGRAARLGPGVCIELWSAHDAATMPSEPIPECARADLSSALLWLAHLGVSDFAQFSWFDPPPAPLMSWARRTLLGLGAIGADGRLTAFGAKLIQYPLAPRAGALLARGEEFGVGSTAARLAAILSDRDFADDREVHANTECDMLYRLDLLREGRSRFDKSVRDAARQLEGLVRPGEGDATDVRRLLLLTHTDRLCRRRSGSERARMVGGRGVRLGPRSQVRTSEFFVALQGMDLPGQPDTVIHLASGFDKDFVLEHLADRVRVVEDVYWDAAKAQFFARRQRYVEDLALDEPSLAPPASAEAVHEAFVELLLDEWDTRVVPLLAGWLARARFLAHHEPQWAEVLAGERRREFLGLAVFGRTRLSEVADADLVALLESVLPAEFVRALRDEVPREFAAPSGVRHAIAYEERHAAYVDVRLQEMFGQAASPKIIYGRVALTFRLLGPNYRPVQVTSDLANFWRVGYIEVRKELRARYPKHAWPDDPLTAPAEAKGRRRN